MKINLTLLFFRERSTTINEVNTGSFATMKSRDFIELKMKCRGARKTDSLQGYKILGIKIETDSTKETQTMTIDLIINVAQRLFTTDGHGRTTKITIKALEVT